LLKLSFSEKATKSCAIFLKVCFVSVKTMRKIMEVFVAFSEKLNFKIIQKINGHLNE
jgi:hypothetical protein